METRRLGGRGPAVPAVGMGTWRTLDLAGPAGEAHGAALVEATLQGGARLLDTSPMYGRAEEVLSLALRGRRERAQVATKVWTGSAREGRAQVEQALAWFGRVEVYQVHNLLAWREHLPVLEDLKQAGRIDVVGATHYQASAFPELLALMQTGRIGQVQVPYNAADREVEREVLPAAEALGLGVVVMRPLGVGELLRASPSHDELARLERFGVRTWAQALLKWILSDPRVHCVIPASSRVERVRENASAGDPPWLDAEAREYVAALAARVLSHR